MKRKCTSNTSRKNVKLSYAFWVGVVKFCSIQLYVQQSAFLMISKDWNSQSQQSLVAPCLGFINKLAKYHDSNALPFQALDVTHLNALENVWALTIQKIKIQFTPSTNMEKEVKVYSWYQWSRKPFWNTQKPLWFDSKGVQSLQWRLFNRSFKNDFRWKWWGKGSWHHFVCWRPGRALKYKNLQFS